MSEKLRRFTRSLRYNTKLEIKRDLKHNDIDYVSVQLWRLKQNKRFTSWKELQTFIKNNEQKNVDALTTLLSKLWAFAKNIIGSMVNADLIDDAAIFLLLLFLDTNIVILSQLTEMKKFFGTASLQLANKICSVVCDIAQCLSDECKNFIKLTVIEKELSHHRWGHHICCNLPNEQLSDSPYLQKFPLTAATGITTDNFSMQYVSPSKKNQPNQFTRSWLLKHIKPDLFDSLINMLKSTNSNVELENNLFELLGVEKLHLIKKILDNRKYIVENVVKEMKKINLMMTTLPIHKQRPFIPTQMTVQSNKLKAMLKKAQKDEKKLKQFLNSQKENEQEDDYILTKLWLAQQNKLLNTAQQSSNKRNQKDTAF